MLTPSELSMIIELADRQIEAAMCPVQRKIVKISNQGQIRIPQEMLDHFHWEVGTKLIVTLTERGMILEDAVKKGNHRLEDLIGSLAYHGPPVSDEQLMSPPTLAQELWTPEG